MDSVGASVTAGYNHSQPQAGQSVGETKHWTQSRTVRAFAVVGVPILGALAGLAVSFFAGPFAAIIAAGAVTVVLGAAVIGYFYHHRGTTSTDTVSTLPNAQTPVTPMQPPPYTASYVPPPPPPPYTPHSVPATTATAYAPAASPNPLPSDPPPGYTRYGTPAAAGLVVEPSDPPPEYTDLIAEEFIHGQENRATRMLQLYDLELYKSCHDGNCYFDSVVNQCPVGSNWTIQNLRNRVYQEALQWCNNYAVNYDPSVFSFENDLYGRLMFQNGLDALRTDKEWVDAADSVFTARVLNTPIVILNMDGTVGHAYDAQGQCMGDFLNVCRDLNYYRTILSDRFIVLVFDINHFMGIQPVS